MAYDGRQLGAIAAKLRLADIFYLLIFSNLKNILKFL